MQIQGYNYQAYQMNYINYISPNINNYIPEVNAHDKKPQELINSLRGIGTNTVTTVPDANYLKTLYEDFTRHNSVIGNVYKLTGMNYQSGSFLNMRI